MMKKSLISILLLLLTWTLLTWCNKKSIDVDKGPSVGEIVDDLPEVKDADNNEVEKNDDDSNDDDKNNDDNNEVDTNDDDSDNDNSEETEDNNALKDVIRNYDEDADEVIDEVEKSDDNDDDDSAQWWTKDEVIDVQEYDDPDIQEIFKVLEDLLQE